MAERRVDSAHIRAKIVKDALTGREPPKNCELRECDKPFWDAIVAARAQWTDVDLFQAVNLARWQADLEEIQKALEAEGLVLVSSTGNQYINPKFLIAEKLAANITRVSVKIQVHATATIGEAKLSREKNALKRHAIEAMEEADDLIARPN